MVILDQYTEKILKAVCLNRVTIITAETGSGKSVFIPTMLFKNRTTIIEAAKKIVNSNLANNEQNSSSNLINNIISDQEKSIESTDKVDIITPQKRMINLNTNSKSPMNISLQFSLSKDQTSLDVVNNPTDELNDKFSTVAKAISSKTIWPSLNKNEFMVYCTQPRRIAATSIANYVSKIDSCGSSVGHHIRFQNTISKQTRVVYATDGVVLELLKVKQDLPNIGVLIIDEVHEQSVSTEILLGLCKILIKKNPYIRIVLMSATASVSMLTNFFEAYSLHIPSRTYEVKIYYSPVNPEDWLYSSVEKAIHIHFKSAPGDCLVFLPGKSDISRAYKQFSSNINLINEVKSICINNDIPGNMKLLDIKKKQIKLIENVQENSENITAEDYYRQLRNVVHLLPPDSTVEELISLGTVTAYTLSAASSEAESHFLVSKSTGSRRIIFSTNVAEASITVPNIKYVIDSGYCKLPYFSPLRTTETLVLEEISKSSAQQRSGRAGRLCDGECHRLYTEEKYNLFSENHTSILLRSDLRDVILLLKKFNIAHVFGFPFLQPVPPLQLGRAILDILPLNILDSTEQLTEHGKNVIQLPLSAILGHFLLLCHNNHCGLPAVNVCAVISAAGYQYITDIAAKRSEDSDFIGLHLAMAELEQKEKESSAELPQWYLDAKLIKKQIIKKLKGPVSSGTQIQFLSSIETSLKHNVATLEPDNTFRIQRLSQKVTIDSGSALSKAPLPEAVVYLSVRDEEDPKLICVSRCRNFQRKSTSTSIKKPLPAIILNNSENN